MFIITFICIICTVNCDIPRIQVSEGTLVGNRRETHNGFPYYEYLQVPYAKPPVGNLRFKSPQPLEPWEGERNATESNVNNVCLQFDLYTNTTRGSEDCLYLNIFTPISSNKTSKKPVMVSIHGGGFIFGNGIIKEENGPDYLIEHDVIMIFINYRLNVFGFFSLRIPEAAGNMGLKDQTMALKWIHDNIDNFGGDKNNVTIFGISAGGASVEYHMLSPLSKGLFNKAIIQSGSTLNNWAINYDIENSGVVLARTLGFNGSSNDVQGIYEFVLNANSMDLFMANQIVANSAPIRGLFYPFGPSIEKDFGNEDTFLYDYPYNLLKAGKFHKVPVMRGFCEFEGYLMDIVPGAVSELLANKNFMEFWKYDLEPEDIIKYNVIFNNIYFNSLNNGNEEQGAINFFGDFEIVSGVITSTKLMTSHGIKPFVYEFAYDGNMNMLKIIFNIRRKGAAHADDTAYLIRMFDHSEVNITSSDKLIIARMTKMWTDFAKIGDPTPDTNDNIIPITWPNYNIYSQKYLVINEVFKLKSFYEPVRMAVFESIYKKYRM